MSGLPEEELDLDTGTTRILSPPEPKMSDDTPPTNMMDGRTWLRQSVSPYLPPPIVRAMAQLDPQLEPYVGPEASITLLTSLLVCLIVVPLLQSLTGTSSGLSSSKGKAIADDDQYNEPLASHQAHQDDFGDTVMLCGPMGAGKTRIFYHLCQGPTQASMPTVMSLRANAALLTSDKDNSNKPIRVLDYPGHSGLQDELFQQLWESSLQPPNKQLRIVLVVDATQSLATSADFLYDLLDYAHANNANHKNKLKVDMLVACHKCDLSSSKNPRRIKLSLRAELEKLIQVRITQAKSNTDTNAATRTTATWWKEGESLDLDQLTNANLRFEATTCNVGDGIDALVEFCKQGTVA